MLKLHNNNNNNIHLFIQTDKYAVR